MLAMWPKKFYSNLSACKKTPHKQQQQQNAYTHTHVPTLHYFQQMQLLLFLIHFSELSINFTPLDAEFN